MEAEVMTTTSSWAATCALVGVATGGLLGQTAWASRKAVQQAAKVTVVGCVERADQVTQIGTPSTTVDSLSFVLLEPKAGSRAPGGAGAPTGTSGSTARPDAGTSAAPRMYRLDGEVETLNPHVGQQVEVTGRLVAADPAPATPAPATTDSPASAPSLKVESLKMLAATCPR
jgi:hypothetical protein